MSFDALLNYGGHRSVGIISAARIGKKLGGVFYTADRIGLGVPSFVQQDF
jgi:hypothetical protein